VESHWLIFEILKIRRIFKDLQIFIEKRHKLTMNLENEFDSINMGSLGINKLVKI